MGYNFNKGSQWRKWDLHVHTPASVLNNQFGDDWDEYVKLLFNTAIQKEIKAIGITDYFSIEGYKKIKKEYIDNYNKLENIFEEEISQDKDYISKIKQILLLPNIEFRLDKIVSSKKDGNQPRRLNYHVIFSNKVDVLDIEENFLEDLKFSYEGSPYDGIERSRLKKNNLEAFGKKLRSEHKKFEKFTDYYVGCMNATVNEVDICDILKKERPHLFENKYILVLAEEYWDLVDWDGQDHGVKKHLLSVSDMIFSSNKRTRQWALTDDFKDEFGDKKPCIWGSDAHSSKELFNPDLDRYCWIKADTTFDGLLQVINEPEDRVFIGKKPEMLKTCESNKSRYIYKLSIDRISNSTLKDEWFNNNSINFNPGLVAIIGSKGSGKSALSDILGLLSNSKNEEHFSFLNTERFRKKPENLSQHFKAELAWLDGRVDERRLSEETVLTEIERVKYLPQKYIEIVCNDLGSGFEQEINNMVFSYLPESEKLKKSSFEDLIDYLCQGIEDETQSYKNDLEMLNKKIIELEEKQNPDYSKQLCSQLSQKRIEINNHMKAKPKEIEKPKEEESAETLKLKELDEKITNVSNQIEDTQELLNDLSVKLTELNLITEKISLLNNTFEKTKKEISEIIKNNNFNINLKLEFSCNTADIDTLRKNIKEEKNNILILLETNKDNQTEKSLYKIKEDLNIEKSKILEDKDSIIREYQEYKEELDTWRSKKSELFGNEKTEGSLKYYIEKYRYVKRELNQEIDKEIKNRKEICGKLHSLKLERANIYKQIYKPVMDRINTMKSIQNEKLNVSVEILPDENFKDKFLNMINQSVSSDFKGKNEGYVTLNEIISKYNFKLEEDVKNFVQDVYSRLTTDKNKINKLLIDREGLYNYLFSLEYLKVEYKLKLGCKNMNQLSPGEKGTILLIFYLVLDKNHIPLIIDQPEDNLDNQFVYEKLVPFIREAKKRRQVIIVTHNPNIAVACDSEQIIYCSKNENNKIKYETGSIENPKINRHIVNVLEGTMPAFTLREIKYMDSEKKERVRSE